MHLPRRLPVLAAGILLLLTACPAVTPPPEEAKNQAPVAVLDVDKTSVQVNETINLDGSGSSDPDGTIVGWEWDCGDGTLHYTQTATHAYPAQGSYTITLTVIDDDGASDTASVVITVTVGQPPEAMITSDRDAVLENETVDFDGSLSGDPDGTIVAWAWDFGDGETDNVEDPAPHTYTTAGAYTVVLVVTDDDGNSDDDTKAITVHRPPVANAGADQTVPLNSEVTFDGSGSYDPEGGSLTFDWSFGDSGTGTGVAPKHTYGSVGDFTVTLEVTDPLGATDTDTLTIHVLLLEAPSAAAGSNQVILFTPPSVSVSFDGSGSDDPDGTIVGYDWDFDDGSPHGAGPTPSHLYSSPGTYTVTLTVTDNDALSDTDSVTVRIHTAPSAAAGTYAPVTVGTLVPFDGSSSSDDGSITSYDWDFGDGSPHGTGATPSHSYAGPGTYTVTLTVTDNDGVADTDSTSVIVHLAPVAAADADQTVFDTLAGIPVTVNFDGSASSDDGSIASYEWDFDDGTAHGFGQTVSHQYPGATAVYQVELTVTDNYGATDTDTVTISVSVNQPPLVEAGPDRSVVLGDSLSFLCDANDPDGSIVLYEWEFGDGGSATGATPSHAYASAGDYTVTVTVTDNDGSSASDSMTVHVVGDAFIFVVEQTGGAVPIDADNPVLLVIMEAFNADAPVALAYLTSPGAAVYIPTSDFGNTPWGTSNPFSPQKQYFVWLLHDIGNDFIGMFGSEDFMALYYDNGGTNYVADSDIMIWREDAGPYTPYSSDSSTWIVPGITYTITYDGGWIQTTSGISIIVQ